MQLPADSMQALAGCAAPPPNKTDLSKSGKFEFGGYLAGSSIAEGVILSRRLARCRKAASSAAGSSSSNSGDELAIGSEGTMKCKTTSPAQQFVCAAPGFDKDFSVTNGNSLPVAVAEFRGPIIHGLVQFVQLSSSVASIEATFDGLDPGAHPWSVNEYGDLTRGPASTGGPYNPAATTATATGPHHGKVAGELGSLEADTDGRATFTTTSGVLTVEDVIGRSVVVYDSSTGNGSRLAAAVIARSAGRSVGRQTLCKCDGTIVWDSQVGLV